MKGVQAEVYGRRWGARGRRRLVPGATVDNGGSVGGL